MLLLPINMTNEEDFAAWNIGMAKIGTELAWVAKSHNKSPLHHLILRGPNNCVRGGYRSRAYEVPVINVTVTMCGVIAYNHVLREWEDRGCGPKFWPELPNQTVELTWQQFITEYYTGDPNRAIGQMPVEVPVKTGNRTCSVQ
jgi:hypothetical protein